MAMQKTKQLTVWVQDRPGILGEVADALGAKKVNILALVPSVVEGSGALRMVVDKAAEAKEIFTQRGWKTTEEELVSFALPDQPGQLGSVSKSSVMPASTFTTPTPARPKAPPRPAPTWPCLTPRLR